MKDPIVNEIRKHRMEHTRKYHGDLSAICADLVEVQKSSGHKLIRLAAKRIEPASQPTRPRRFGG
jgi:hypothetical protein